MPHFVFHLQADEPPIEHVVFQMLHQLSFTAYGVEYLQRRCSHQSLWRHRFPPQIGVGRLKQRVQRLQGLINQCADCSERVSPGYKVSHGSCYKQLGLTDVASAHDIALGKNPVVSFYQIPGLVSAFFSKLLNTCLHFVVLSSKIFIWIVL